MNVINDISIFQKYFEPISQNFLRRNSDITEIVIHGTGGGNSAKEILKWMMSGEREKEYKKGVALFHHEIDLEGTLYNVIPVIFWCYHSSSGQHDKNTIGIELVNPVAENQGSYTEKQYNSLVETIDYTLKLFPINSIVGHGYNKMKYSKSYKNCPGQAFEWGRLEKHFNLKKIQHECYSVS